MTTSTDAGEADLARDTAPSAVRPDPPAIRATDAHLKLAEELHQYVREYVRNADQKAAFFFAAATAGLTYLLTHHVALPWFRRPLSPTVTDLVGALATAGLAASAALLLSVVFPRLGSSGPGPIFFYDIAGHRRAEDYAATVIGVEPTDIAATKLRHVYDLARVCRAKYRTLRAGFWAGTVGGAAALLYVALRAAGL